MRDLFLYNTASRTKERFAPIGDVVGMYCCGPTVYNYAHIGNLRAYIFEDVLRRTLLGCGYRIKHVMNITDVGHLTSDADEGEDRMVKGARREGKSVWDIARYYEEAFFRDAAALNIQRPDVVCRATEYVAEMIELIKRIEANGFTYVADGNVCFDVSRFPHYAELARLDMERMRAGARVEVDSAKRNPADFVLWFTKSKFGNQDMQWESPWGRGFPGWAIECSAMAIKNLGEQFDIHCGGIDHIPGHHTNEIAQSESATGKHPWVRYWLHNEFIVFNKGKMSKTGDNFLTLDSVREQGLDVIAWRAFCFSAQHRSPLTFSWEGVQASAQSLKNLRKIAAEAKARAGEVTRPDAAKVEDAVTPFWDALCDDLNVPKAMAAVWDLLRSPSLGDAERLAAVARADEVLALDLLKPEAASAGSVRVEKDGVVVTVMSVTPLERSTAEEIAARIVERKSARKAKDFARADSIRDELARRGVSVRDLPDGSSECTVD
jgi:cysteinyl-tRNA synthetase